MAYGESALPRLRFGLVSEDRRTYETQD